MATKLPQPLVKLFNCIDENTVRYILDLGEAVAIPSVSAWPDNRNDIRRMAEWIAERLTKLKVEVTLRELDSMQQLRDGRTVPLPPVVFGVLGNKPKKKTILIYGHLDVQPALLEDGWDSPPFVLTERNGKLYGRGSSDDKGPVLGWLHTIEAYQEIGEEIPVNLKFVFEGMMESGSLGLHQLLLNEKNKFLANVDYVCISDNYWLGPTYPCITYALRGYCYFCIEIICASKDLHSGVFGGTVNEAMTDLVYLLNSLLEKDGTILIKGIYDDVAPLLPNERDLYTKIHFDVPQFRSGLGVHKLLWNEDKVDLLMKCWRYPSLSIHGIQGDFSEPGHKTVIPGKVVGKFSIRTVPNQKGANVEALVLKHLYTKFQERGSANEMRAYMHHSGQPWIEDPLQPHYMAAQRAIKHVYNVEPDLTRAGSSIPVTFTLQNATGKSVILLPLGAGDDGAHSQNEKMDIRNYIEGTKVLGAYLYEVALLP